MLNPDKVERAINGARIGGLLGLIGYYIPLLSGIISVERLIPVIFFFVLTAAIAAAAGGTLGFITHSKN